MRVRAATCRETVTRSSCPYGREVSGTSGGGLWAGWGSTSPGVDADAVVLAMTETVTNSVRRGSPPVSVELMDEAPHLWMQLNDGSDDLPHNRGPGVGQEGGRGLDILEAVTDRWGVTVKPTEARPSGACSELPARRGRVHPASVSKPAHTQGLVPSLPVGAGPWCGPSARPRSPLSGDGSPPTPHRACKVASHSRNGAMAHPHSRA
jgi:hypothetical protein